MALRKLKYISLIFASIISSVTVALSEQRTLSAFQSFEEIQRATENGPRLISIKYCLRGAMDRRISILVTHFLESQY